MEHLTQSDGTKLSRLWLGTVTFGSWGNADVDECVRMIHHALDAGVNAIDTAETYCDGESEEIVGQALRDRRDAVFLATKVGRPDAGGRPGPMTKEGVVASLEASLRRLGTDHVDLYQVHRLPSDEEVPEVFEALHDLMGAGKIRAIGTSSVPADRLARLATMIEDTGLSAVSTEQAPHSIFVRVVEPAVIETCARLGVALVGYAPFNGGWLSGKYRLGSQVPADSRAATWPVRRDRFDAARTEVERKLRLIEELLPIAQDLDTDLIGLSLAFALSTPGVSGTIVGARRPDQLTGVLGAAELRLSDADRGRIDELVAPGSVVDPEDALPYRG